MVKIEVKNNEIRLIYEKNGFRNAIIAYMYDGKIRIRESRIVEVNDPKNPLFENDDKIEINIPGNYDRILDIKKDIIIRCESIDKLSKEDCEQIVKQIKTFIYDVVISDNDISDFRNINFDIMLKEYFGVFAVTIFSKFISDNI